MKKLLACFAVLIFALFLLYYVFSISSPVAYAQSPGASDTTNNSNCVLTSVGNPPNNQPLPAGCGGTASGVVENVIKLGQANLHHIYVWGSPPRNWAAEKPNTASAPNNFDCSGFVGWIWYWGSNGTISMQGQTNADWADTSNPHYQRVATNSEASLQPGDIIYFNFGEDPPDHVGVYVGKDSSKYSCGANDCFIQFYESGLPGNEVSLKTVLPYLMGYIRIKNP